MKTELDLVIYKLQTYIPGFYPGCTMKIVNLDHWQAKFALGKTITAPTELKSLKAALESFERRETSSSISQGNEYCVNYYPDSVKVISTSLELTDFITTIESAIKLTNSLNPKFSVIIRNSILNDGGKGIRYGEKRCTFSENLEDVSTLLMDWVSWGESHYGYELSAMYHAAQSGLNFFKDRVGNYENIFNHESDKQFAVIISKFNGAPDIQERMIRNYDRSFLGTCLVNSVESLLAHSFSWDRSPERRAEWKSLSIALQHKCKNVEFCSRYYDCSSGYPVEYRQIPDLVDTKPVVIEQTPSASKDLVICNKFQVGDILCMQSADYRAIMPVFSFGKIDSRDVDKNKWFFTFEGGIASWHSDHVEDFRLATPDEKAAFERLNILYRPVKIEEIKDEVHDNYTRLRGSGLRLEEFEMSSAIAEKLSSISPIFIKKETVTPFTVTEEEVKIKIKSKQPIKISVK